MNAKTNSLDVMNEIITDESYSVKINDFSLPDHILPFLKYPPHHQTNDNITNPKSTSSTTKKILRYLLIGALSITTYPFWKMHIVPTGYIGLYRDGSEPKFLPPGTHFLLSATKHFIQNVPETKNYITHGHYTIVRVREGEIGFGFNTKTGSPVFLMQGSHILNDPAFKWVIFLDLAKEIIKYEAWEWITIKYGKVGIAYVKNTFTVLKPGFHFLKKPDFLDFIIETKQKNININQEFQTSDFLDIILDVNVDFTIQSFESAFTRIFTNESDMYIKIEKISKSIISNLIRISDYQQIHDTKKPYEIWIRDEFLKKTKRYIKEYGILIEDITFNFMRFTDTKITDGIKRKSIGPYLDADTPIVT